MGDKEIVKALSLIDILKGIRNFLEKDNQIEELINKGMSNIKSNYSFEKQKDNFRKYLLHDFQDIIKYTQEDKFDEETYFKNRKVLKEFHKEYYLFYKFLSKYIKKNIKEHEDIKSNLSYIFGTTYAREHKKYL